MRVASLIFLSLFATPLPADFSVTHTSTDSPELTYGTIESHTSAVSDLEPNELQETLSRTAAKLGSTYREIIDGALSALSTDAAARQFGVTSTWSGLRYTLSAPKSSSFFNPDGLRLDILFDINGVDMGGLGTVSGAPIGNGRQGIVRIDGMSGQRLAEHFEPLPYIELQSSITPKSDDSDVTFVQQVACLLFVAAALLSSLRHRQQLDQQLALERRRLIEAMKAEQKSAMAAKTPAA